MEHSKAADSVTAGMITNRISGERVGAGGIFTVTCVGADGKEKWSDTFNNLVTNVGLVDMNTQYFTGSAYTASWFLGLVQGPGSTTSFSANDTLAVHAGFVELVPGTAYTGNRKVCTFGTATTADPSVITNSASVGSFAMLVNGTSVAGALLASVNSGTSGVMFSAGDFTGGDKSVDNGDTLNVTYSFSLDAA